MPTPITGAPTPLYTAIPDVPADLLALGSHLEKFAIPRFATAAARDAAITVPVAGMAAYVTGTGYVSYNGSAWVPFYTIPVVPAQATGLATVTVPANASAGTLSVNLPAGRFSAIPAVLATVNSGAGSAIKMTLLVYNRTATSFTLGAYPNATQGTAANYDIMWHAIEQGF